MTQSNGASSDRRLFMRLLNAMPVTTDLYEWVTTFREVLRDFFGDVDRVSINVNTSCSLDPEAPHRTNIIMSEDISAETGESVVRVSMEADETTPSERLIEEFRRNGHPVDASWPPVAEDYYFGSSYLGTIFLWRDRSQSPISRDTVELFREMRPFLLFALTDIVARHNHARPHDDSFNDALAELRREARLSDQESRVLVLLLYGQTYDQIASAINLSLDAIRKHLQSIYRKTGTKSRAELFAKYFTTRQRL